MTTGALPTRLSPFSQMQQLCTSLQSLLGSVTESADDAFRRVEVIKKNPDGTIKLYEKQETREDPITKEKQIITQQYSSLTYIEDMKNGNIYLDEPEYVIAVKCAFIALGLPFYTVGKMCWHAVKTVFDIGVVAYKAINRVGHEFLLGRLYESSSELRYAVMEISHVFGMGLFEIVNAPLFALGCELAAIYGIFRPYHGRKIEAFIENAWQQGQSYRKDLRYVQACQPGDSWIALKKFVKDFQNAHTCYLAHCFQVRGNVNEERIEVIARTAIR